MKLSLSNTDLNEEAIKTNSYENVADSLKSTSIFSI